MIMLDNEIKDFLEDFKNALKLNCVSWNEKEAANFFADCFRSYDDFENESVSKYITIMQEVDIRNRCLVIKDTIVGKMSKIAIKHKTWTEFAMHCSEKELS